MPEQQNGALPATAGGAPAPEVRHTVLRRGRSYGEEAIQAMVPVIRQVAQRHGRSDLELNWYDIAANAFSAVWSYCEQVSELTPRDAELVQLRSELTEIRAKLAEVHDAAQYDDITTVRAVEMLAEQRDSMMAGWGRCHAKHIAQRDEAAQLQRRLDEHLADENSAQAANDRLRDEIQNLNAGHEATLRFITLRLADILDTSEETALTDLLDMVQGIVDARDEFQQEWHRADAEVTRLKRLVGNENIPYDGWDGFSRQDAIVRCEEGWQEYLKVRDELTAIRERLAIELNRKPSENGGVPTIDLVDDMAGRWRTAVTHLRMSQADLGEARETIGRVAGERNEARSERDKALRGYDRLRAAQQPAFEVGERVKVGKSLGTVDRALHILRIVLDDSAVVDVAASATTRLCNAPNGDSRCSFLPNHGGQWHDDGVACWPVEVVSTDG
jgi:regulator of RNase E activity RraB